MVTLTRDKRFGFVLTSSEKDWLGRLAEAEGGLSEAAVIRRLIRRAVKALDTDQERPNQVREVKTCQAT